MVDSAAGSVVRDVNGILIRKSDDGTVEIISNGQTLNAGDALVLLSGKATLVTPDAIAHNLMPNIEFQLGHHTDYHAQYTIDPLIDKFTSFTPETNAFNINPLQSMGIESEIYPSMLPLSTNQIESVLGNIPINPSLSALQEDASQHIFQFEETMPLLIENELENLARALEINTVQSIGDAYLISEVEGGELTLDYDSIFEVYEQSAFSIESIPGEGLVNVLRIAMDANTADLVLEGAVQVNLPEDISIEQGEAIFKFTDAGEDPLYVHVTGINHQLPHIEVIPEGGF